MKPDALWKKCAGLFMVGFDGLVPNDAIKGLIDDGIYGAILFKRNVESAEQTTQLIRSLKSQAGTRPLVLAVDQEGGRVARMRGAGFTALPPMRVIGATHDEKIAERTGRLLAYEMRAVGFDWDFAPVLDVDTNPANPVIGDRSLHTDANEVARLGVALGRGLEAGGVASCGKHFPGHGDTEKDSHLDLPRLPHALDRLRKIELVPFAAWAKSGLSSLMTAHVVFDALDPGVPATLSSRVLKDLLRGELGFNQVLVSDDLEMKAIKEHFTLERAVVDGANATVDLFLVCHKEDSQRLSITALADAVRAGRVSEERIDEATQRLTKLAAKFARPAAGTLGSPEHLALAAGLAAGSFTGIDPTER